MCGIAGILNRDGKKVDAELMGRMRDALTHRGPDDFGSHIEGSIGLAHRRLSILDLSTAGRQPLCNEDRSVWITYNGEIYNFATLRAELEALGHHFASHTDTEVIVHAYEQWGLECLDRLRGMFAFGLWDSRRRRLWLVRDRMGIKPLFYSALPDALLFGSEIKSLLEHPAVSRRLDRRALAYYLAMNWIPAPHTLLADVRQLLPGHFLLLENGSQRNVCYWDLSFREAGNGGRRAWQEEFDALMDSTVREHLVSDVPFGAFLSGGLDSSSLCWWMSRNLAQPLKTFSFAFSESTYNETPYARMVARRMGSDHREASVTPELVDILPRLVRHAEEPTADSSMIGVYYLAREARREVTMVHSGDGADEILAGYETYKAYALTNIYRHLPRALRRFVRSLVNCVPASDAKVSWDTKLRRFVAGAEWPPEDAHAMWRVIFDHDERSELLAPLWHDPEIRADIVDVYREYFARSDAKDPLNRMLYVDSRLYLPNDMLVKVDRMTMAHGLEARVPFLDHKVVEFCASVPKELKLCRGSGKYLLKQVMRERLPAPVLRRKKEGFNVPNARWLRQELKPFVTDVLSERSMREMGIFSPIAVRKLLEDHFSRRRENSHRIWCLLTLSLWWRTFMEGSGPA
ncbi:MAG: asparagine synthase (glutamine-hydrolyzing) [Pseudomonadota bacterium]